MLPVLAAVITGRRWVHSLAAGALLIGTLYWLYFGAEGSVGVAASAASDSEGYEAVLAGIPAYRDALAGTRLALAGTVVALVVIACIRPKR